MQNCIVAQSGGPTVAINASLAGVITAAKDNYDNIYGSLNGIEGILNNNILNLSEKMKEIPDFIDKLKITPAMYLGSCRYKMPKMDADPQIYKKIFDFFKANDITGFYYIGGNDSMDTVLQLSKYAAQHDIDAKIMGVPKTIDNDLCLTDHTPGFGSAAKYIATSMQEIAYDTSIYALDSVTIVEIMGRDAGWLTASAALAKKNYGLGPDMIYLPEVAFDTEVFISDLKELLTHKHNALIAISEGIRDSKGNYISASSATVDSFGHSQLSGAGKTLEYLVKDKLGVKVRSIEINLPQRAAAHLASATDIEESMKLGEIAVEKAMSGTTGEMAIIIRENNSPYTVSYDSADISKIANEVKSVPAEYITESGNNVTQEMIDYLSPLIVGETKLSYSGGLPNYLSLEHLY
ncbi:MAG: 6-phosphofructokinase [Lachnospiraceae bacterium]|nr:6-phosphofructokinase [Lachnospiraceae bacterium]